MGGPPIERSRDSNNSSQKFGPVSPPLCLLPPIRKEGRKVWGKRKKNRRGKERGEDGCLPGIRYLGVGGGGLIDF